MDNSPKHAYLIMAHHHFDQLADLLEMLDDARNDFFLHIDARAGSVNVETIQRAVKKGRLTILPRMSVCWGGDSQSKCMLRLFRSALLGEYRYYHMLSGDDLPLKTQEEIHDYFARHDGKEFVVLGGVGNLDDVRYFYFFHNYIKRTGWKILARMLNPLSIFLQKTFRVNRLSDDVYYGKGATWCSITHALAKFVVNQADHHDLWKKVRWTRCGDERLVQIAVANSAFAQRLFDEEQGMSANVRYTDWERSNGKSPYTFDMNDWDMLLRAPALFARKVSVEKDARLIFEMKKRLLGAEI